MSQFVPKEDGVSTREPSTANLMIDSIDRNFGPNQNVNATGANFTINKKNSILNGFFTRLAVTEIVLDWCIFNISEAAGNNTLTATRGAGAPITVTLPDGNYTVARALNSLPALFTAAGVATYTIVGTVETVGYAALVCDVPFTITATNLSNELTLTAQAVGTVTPVAYSSFSADCPNLLPYTYLDFVCSDITYNQALKDDTTNSYQRNVLYRWVFAWDAEPTRDALGYPIFQGYLPFRARRYLSYPKQIRWESNMPVGQLTFNVYSSEGQILEIANNLEEFEWNMLLQVSEV